MDGGGLKLSWLFYALLVCNGLFFAWQWFDRESKSDEVVAQGAQQKTPTGLRLLSEVDDTELRPRARAGAQTVESKASPSKHARISDAVANSSPAPVCYSLGPLPGEGEVEQLRGWVLAAGGAPRVRMAQRREHTLSWVYLPPFATRDEAVRVAQEMARSGIKDIFAIPRGDMANAISLGVYARNSSLERRLRQLKARGYDASVLPRYRAQPEYWMDARFPAPKNFSQHDFNARFPPLEAVATSCETMLSDSRSNRQRGSAADIPLQ